MNPKLVAQVELVEVYEFIFNFKILSFITLTIMGLHTMKTSVSFKWDTSWGILGLKELKT